LYVFSCNFRGKKNLTARFAQDAKNAESYYFFFSVERTEKKKLYSHFGDWKYNLFVFFGLSAKNKKSF